MQSVIAPKFLMSDIDIAYREYPGHEHKKKSGKSHEDDMPGIHAPGATGVIYCTDRYGLLSRM